MLQIGEFSKMGRTTVKTLRYYDEIGLLKPRAIDQMSRYRLYEASQLTELHRIQSLRQIGLSVSDVQRIVSGNDAKEILLRHSAKLQEEIAERQVMLSQTLFMANSKREDALMPYNATVKHIPKHIIYCKEYLMPSFEDYFREFPILGQKLLNQYPDLKLATPEYCYIINLDKEWRETDNHILFCEAVTELKENFDDIRFEMSPAVDVVSVMHKGAYEEMGAAFAFAMEWIGENGYEVVGEPRSSYIDGIWNKEDVSEWLTEVQIPVHKKA